MFSPQNLARNVKVLYSLIWGFRLMAGHHFVPLGACR